MTEQTKQFAPLVKRILTDGKCLEGGILKVDNFINHQIDPELLKQMSIELVRRFAAKDINKILTIEASGIAPAIMMGFLLDVPVVFAKKKKPSTMSDMLVTSVFSFTKQRSYDLANGNAAKGIIDLINQAEAELVGMGFLIEKAFQHGGDYLRGLNIQVESLAIIESLDNCTITIKK